jgi:AcrR family transcriptional regulator
MGASPIRDRKARETRARIAKAALNLFMTQGYAATSMDEIAQAADVGRRTIFEHFPTKEAILFDHLVVRRKVAVQRLHDRPPSEAPIVSLYAAMRELCEEGYDRQYLSQIRAVLKAEPRFAYGELSLGTRAFERSLLATLKDRVGERESSLELRAVTLMVLAWVDAANRAYLFEGQRSLVEYFDEVVATCLITAQRDLRRSLEGGRD